MVMDVTLAHRNKALSPPTPDPETPFVSRSYAMALDALAVGVEQRQGMVAIIGAAGVGKTTLLRAFLKQADERTLRTVQLDHPQISFDTLVASLASALGLAPETADLPRLHQALIGDYLAGRRVILIIDDAQYLPVATLTQLHELMALQTHATKLLQMVLLGQPEFVAAIDRMAPHLEPHITMLAELSPLTVAESEAYIRHQFAGATLDGEALFTQEALQCIGQYARGIPRDLNILGTDVLNACLAEHKTPITAAAVKRLLGDFKRQRPRRMWFRPRIRLQPRTLAASAALLLVAGLIAGAVWLHQGKPATASAGAASQPLPAASAAHHGEPRDALIRRLQERLLATGFDPGPIDGLYGPLTRQALSQFQKAYGLDTTGELNPATRKVLGL
jgi:type II secretory pathway predicted ATPase ExeA